MELEVGAQTGADYGEKSAEGLAQRNGYRDRGWQTLWQTRGGSVELRIPRLRAGFCFLSFLEPRRLVEKALTAVIQDACVHGVSTRLVDDLVQAMGGTGISQILDVIQWLKERGGMAIIIIAHNYAQIFDVCDRINLVEGGKIVFDKPTVQTPVQELTDFAVNEYRMARKSIHNGAGT